jgi:hypothetical protein
MYLLQILLMPLIIGSNGAYHWAPKYGDVAVVLLVATQAIIEFRDRMGR